MQLSSNISTNDELTFLRPCQWRQNHDLYEQYSDLLKNPDRTQDNCEKSAKDPK